MPLGHVTSLLHIGVFITFITTTDRIIVKMKCVLINKNFVSFQMFLQSKIGLQRAFTYIISIRQVTYHLISQMRKFAWKKRAGLDYQSVFLASIWFYKTIKEKIYIVCLFFFTPTYISTFPDFRSLLQSNSKCLIQSHPFFEIWLYLPSQNPKFMSVPWMVQEEEIVSHKCVLFFSVS